MMNKKNKNFIEEIRKDLVSREWILVSSIRGRGKKPNFLSKKKKVPKKDTKKNCPFEDPQKSGNPKPIIWFAKKEAKSFNDWFIQVIPNKYPMLLKSDICPTISHYGPYEKIEAVGFHEVIIMRDHNKPIERMSLEEIILILKAYRQRYKMLEKNKCVEYVLIFHNQGESAGATIEHPHSQLVAMPIIPPDVSRSINGGINFYKKNKKCVHCTMIDYERKEGKRIVAKNPYFITICPYTSRVSYETRIFPIEHSSDFEEISDKELVYLAHSLKDALHRISKALKNPDYNFFIHTASAKVKDIPYYHWHIEILPRTYKWAGVELGTGVEVVVVPPEEAAGHLRSVF
ncbi:MAG: DUF4921 family protein [Patescibacteria group bacterium]